MDELWRESASSLAELIRRGEVTSREVARAHLGRIEEVNSALNAVVEVRESEVLEAADAADAHQRSGGSLGVLHGVPFTVKTNLDVSGYATTQGTAAYRDVVATRDAPIVERLRAAGAVVLARTNMPDLGLRVNTESSLYGATHNPWRHGVTAGGSSGGDAAALAAGMSPLGLGNDIGGSLRNPAYCCGVASLKPSRGRIPRGNPSALDLPPLNSQIMAVDGLLARRVGDLREALSVVAGAHQNDPLSLDVALRGAPVARRVALVAEPEGGATDPAIAEGVRAAGRALAAAGYEVEQIAPPLLSECYVNWGELMWTSLRVIRSRLEAVMGPDARRYLELTDVEFAPVSGPSQALMHETRFRIARAWRQFFTTYPLVVGPTWTQPPFPLGADVVDREGAWRVVEMCRFVLPANLLGLPVACVATGLNDGLPTGVQVIGDRFREDLCLDAADVIEHSLGVLTPIDPRGPS